MSADQPRPPRPGAAASLRRIGLRLAELGLSERAVHTCFGVGCVAQIPARISEPPQHMSPAALMPWLWVGGATVELAPIQRMLGEDLAFLVDAGWLKLVDDRRVRATRAILPIAESLVVTDRADCRSGADAVLFPDDSAFHLLGALPMRRVSRWLDVGTGCAIAPLARRGLGHTVVASDIHHRALVLAGEGIALSGAAGIDLVQSDVLDAIEGSWDLISFNAPIPAEAGADAEGVPTLYRHAPAGARVLDRFWTAAADLIAPDGEVVMHSWIPPTTYPPPSIRGSALLVRYTPEGSTLEFGVTFWRPGSKLERRTTQFELTARTPHVRRPS